MPWSHLALLGDGGIHDNLGLDPAIVHSTVYGSDAGFPFIGRWRVPADWLRQTLAAWKLATHEVSVRRRAEFSHALANEERCGAVWESLENLRAAARGGLMVERGLSDRLAEVHTRLWPLGDHTAKAVLNLGYATCDDALRRGDPSVAAVPGWPYDGVRLDVAR